MTRRASLVKLGGPYGGRFRFLVGRKGERLAVAFEVAPAGATPGVVSEAVTARQARKIADELSEAAKRIRAAVRGLEAKAPAKRGFFRRLTGR